VNAKGEFNVPYGVYKDPDFVLEDRIRKASAVLKHLDIYNADFSYVLDASSKGDLVYFDPPYHPISTTSAFTAYNRDGFGFEEQQRLMRLMSKLDKKGALVVLSNSASDEMIELYSGLESFTIERVDARRAINCNGSKRGTVGEIIVTNVEPAHEESWFLPRVSLSPAKRMDRVWEQVINGLSLDLTKDVPPPIPATAFRKYADFEARNACKIDSSQDLPTLLRSKNMFPLPIENGSYVLVKGQGFHEFEPIDSPTRTFDSKLDYEVTTATGLGESVFMHYAYNTGLLSDFVGIDALWKTNEGRFYADEFSFMVGQAGPIVQKSTQIQVDGLFEGRDSIVIIEAKTKEHPDFIVRQLYYPYRHWIARGNKNIKSIFMSVDLDSKAYSLWQYHFSRPDDYGSIELDRSARFVIRENPHDGKELDRISADPELMDIPQADDVEKVCLMPLFIAEGFTTSGKLAKRVGFTSRQALYYTEAAEQLGLVERSKAEGKMRFSLTEMGEKVVASRPDRRHELVAEQLMRLPIMKAVFDDLMDNGAGRCLSRDDVAQIIQMNSRLNRTTSYRRAGTVCAWFSWMSSHYGVIETRGNYLALYESEQRSLDVF
jgi:hypothetical protein